MEDAKAPPVVLVLARADNGVIGRRNWLPWRLPRDLAHYKRTTMGCPMIMGRKTWESIGRPLPGRESIVVTRDRNYEAIGAHVVSGAEEALAVARRLASGMNAPAIVIAGGAEIYSMFLPRAERIELTEVHMDADGDTVLDPFPAADWQETARTRHTATETEPADFSFVTLERRKPAGA